VSDGRAMLAATARRLKAEHSDLLRPPVSFRRPDLDRAFDAVARRRAAQRLSPPPADQLRLDLRS
jgi:hypothetical protein